MVTDRDTRNMPYDGDRDSPERSAVGREYLSAKTQSDRTALLAWRERVPIWRGRVHFHCLPRRFPAHGGILS
jgi:hypothetical protein